MDRKQTGILAALLVLIVIVGYASWKLNGDLPDLNSPVGGFGTQQSENEDDDFYITNQVDRDNKAAASMLFIENLINDEKTPEDEKTSLIAQSQRMIDQLEKEHNLESALKAQGFTNVLCLVADDFNGVKVYVKAEEELSEDQMSEIRATVVSQTKIREVEIFRK